jgi:hypothetical protein
MMKYRFPAVAASRGKQTGKDLIQSGIGLAVIAEYEAPLIAKS